MKNIEIYQHAVLLKQAFENAELNLPAKANFYIQKNTNTLLALGQEIEKSLMDVSDEAERAELLDAEQEVKIYKFKIDDLKDRELLMEQMNAIMFMIEEE